MHTSIVRVIELKHTMIKFYVNLTKQHRIVPITLDESMVKYVTSKDEKMIRELYQFTFSHIRHHIDEL